MPHVRRIVARSGIALICLFGLGACYAPAPGGDTAPSTTAVDSPSEPTSAAARVVLQGANDTIVRGATVDTSDTAYWDAHDDVWVSFSAPELSGTIEFIGPNDSGAWMSNEPLQAGRTYSVVDPDAASDGDATVYLETDDDYCSEPSGSFTVARHDRGGTEVQFSISCAGSSPITGTVTTPRTSRMSSRS